MSLPPSFSPLPPSPFFLSFLLTFVARLSLSSLAARPFFNPFKPGEEIGFAVCRVCQINGTLPPLLMVPAGRQRTFLARTSRSIKRLISGQSRGVHRLHALDLPFCPFLPLSLSLTFAGRAYLFFLSFFFFFTQFLPFYPSTSCMFPRRYIPFLFSFFLSSFFCYTRARIPSTLSLLFRVNPSSNPLLSSSSYSSELSLSLSLHPYPFNFFFLFE